MAIVTAGSKIKATVEHITEEKTGQYGAYKSVLFKRSDLQGDEAKVWRAMKPEEVEQLSKGQQVYLIPTERKGKSTWDIEIRGGAPSASPVTTNQTGLTPEQKKAIATYVTEQSKLFGFCLQQARTEMPDLSEESHRAIATTLFITVQKKFGV
ncbi:MAG: hypothetical protein AAFU78_17370 [Cyanobacteria bacterium J06633_2]